MGDFWLHGAPIGQGLPQDPKGGPGVTVSSPKLNAVFCFTEADLIFPLVYSR